MDRAHWQQPMRENLCVIDLDNRRFSAPGEIYGPEAMDWGSPNGVHGLSLGLLNHYVYGMLPLCPRLSPRLSRAGGQVD